MAGSHTAEGLLGSTDHVDAEAFSAAFRIDASQRLAQFDTSGGKAYGLQNADGSPFPGLFAFVHEPSVPYRGDVCSNLISQPVTNLLNPRLQAVVQAPTGKGTSERLVTLVERPGGPALMPAQGAKPLPSAYLKQMVLPAFVRLLEALHGKGIVHRGLRPGNLFFADKSAREILIGDCFSTPPAMDQPAAFECVQRTRLAPSSRGTASEADDIFAVGATLLSLYLGGTIGRTSDPEALTMARLAQGSFWALSDGKEIPGNLGVALRNLMNDDPDERWTLDELRMWMDSNQPARRAVMSSFALSRPVNFRGRSYNDRRLLAKAFAADAPAAASFLRDQDIATWMQSNLNNEFFTDRIERLLNVRKEKDYSSDHSDDHAMIARVCAHLDPTGPVRYRGLEFAYDSLGPALAAVFASNDTAKLEAFRDLLGSMLMSTILDIVAKRNPDAQAIAPDVAKLRGFVGDAASGRGLERALYHLNPSLPCVSPRLAAHWVASDKTLLATLDGMAQGKSSFMESLTDRHILAFAASRNVALDRYLPQLEASHGNPDSQMLRSIDFYAAIQRGCARLEVPNLVEQTLTGLGPIVASLKGKTARTALEKEIKRLKGTGDLNAALERLDIETMRRRDREGFEKAGGVVRAINRQIKSLARPLRAEDIPVQALAHRIASWSGVAMVSLVSLYLWMGA